MLCVALEPEEESPIVFLRLRKAARKGTHQGVPHRTVDLAGGGEDDPPARSGQAVAGAAGVPPGGEAAAVDGLPSTRRTSPSALGGAGRGDPGRRAGRRRCRACSPPSAKLAETTGARVAWIPRRAGERGALDAGAVPTLLPGGRLVSDAAARAEVEQTWGLPAGALPGRRGRDTDGDRRRGRRRQARRPGGRRRADPTTCPTRRSPSAALDKAGFVVSLELRASAVTERADVVLPVAPAVEKSGSFLNWEGRRREFGTTLEGTGSLSGLPGARHARRRDGRRPVHPDPAGGRRGPGPAARGAARRAAAAPRSPPPAPDARRTARRCSPPGASCWTTARCSPTSRTSPAPPAPTVARLSPATARAVRPQRRPRGHRHDRAAARSPCRSSTRTCPTASSGCPRNSGAATTRRTLGAGHGDVVVGDRGEPAEPASTT